MAVLRNGKNSFLDIVTPVILKKILKNMNTMHMRFLKGYIRDILKIQKNKLSAIWNFLIALMAWMKFTYLDYLLEMLMRHISDMFLRYASN